MFLFIAHQTGIFYRDVLSAEEKDRLCRNIAGHLKNAVDFIQERAVSAPARIMLHVLYVCRAEYMHVVCVYVSLCFIVYVCLFPCMCVPRCVHISACVSVHLCIC